jgi:hypothetical protein
MLAVRSAVPATYAVREFVEIGGKFCGADRSPLQADSSIGSSTEVSGDVAAEQAVMAPSCLLEYPLSWRVSGAERTYRGHR